MAFPDWTFAGPVAITSPGGFLYQWKELLKNSGAWNCTKSGDGLAIYSGSGDILTHAGSGANGLNNVNAWFLMRNVASGREFVVQLLNTTFGEASGNGNCTMMYSKGGLFGVGNATTIPTATDDETWNPSVNRVVGANVATMYFFGGAHNEGFAFWTASVDNDATTSCQCGFAFDEIVGEEGDTDPVVLITQNSNTGNSWTESGTGGLADTQHRAWYQSGYSSTLQAPSNPIADAVALTYSGKFGLVPLFWRNNSMTIKGWSKYFRYLGISDVGEGTDRRQVYQLVTPADMIRIGSCALPWNGSTPSGWTDGGDVIELVAGFGADEQDPVITNLTPAPGELTERQAIEFDVTDVSPGLRLVALWIKFTNQRRPWVVYDGETFWDPFDGNSEVSAITDGYHFVLQPNGIWPDTSFDLTVTAIDAAGNLEGD